MIKWLLFNVKWVAVQLLYNRREQVIFRKDDVHFKLLADLNNSPQERRVAPLGYIILIPEPTSRYCYSVMLCA